MFFELFPLSLIFKKEKPRLRIDRDGFVKIQYLPKTLKAEDEQDLRNIVLMHNACLARKLIIR